MTSDEKSMGGPCENTDRHLWPQMSEPGAPHESLHITRYGFLGINCGGYVYEMPISEWHKLAGGPFPAVADAPVSSKPRVSDSELAGEIANLERLRLNPTGLSTREAYVLLALYELSNRRAPETSGDAIYEDMEGLLADAARYRRLQILGCAVMGTPQLDRGAVSRFTNLDEIVDADLKAHPSRGEDSPVEPRRALKASEPQCNERCTFNTGWKNHGALVMADVDCPLHGLRSALNGFGCNNQEKNDGM